MANGRGNRKGGGSKRDDGPFVALPWSVLDCPAYGKLSPHAKLLLVELARQYVRENNGRLLLSRAYMAGRGWKSNDMLSKAKAELLAGGFIFEMVKGQRPNKASWYAVTWHTLDHLPGYDIGAAASFVRSAYKNDGLGPPHGTGTSAIAPPHGTGKRPSVPPHGPIRPVFRASPVPPHGHHLETPSAVAGTKAPGTPSALATAGVSRSLVEALEQRKTRPDGAEPASALEGKGDASRARARG